MARYPIEALLRPPVEWSSSLGAASLAAMVWRAPDLWMMTPAVADGVVAALSVLAGVRFLQGWRVVRYQRGLRGHRRFRIPSRQLDRIEGGLFLGRGFLWTARHTQRLWDATRAHHRRYVEAHQAASSGLPALHGVGWPEGEQRIVLPPAERQGHVFVVGTTGVGKTWIACALAQHACRLGYTARYVRLPRLLPELALARADGRYPKLLREYAKAQVLVIDDWGLAPLTSEGRRDVLEILDDRHHRQSTLVTSQLPVASWHAYLDEPTLADALLDRLVHNAYTLNLTGESLRKRKTPLTNAITEQ